MPLVTTCPKHRGNPNQPYCETCLVAVANFRLLRKRNLEALSKANRERRQRKQEREEKRAYEALLASLTPKKRRERVRWLKDADGWPRCSKHQARLTARKNKQRKNQTYYCPACDRDSKRRAQPKRLERKRQALHDGKLGTLHSIRSPLAQLIKTGIAPCRKP